MKVSILGMALLFLPSCGGMLNAEEVSETLSLASVSLSTSSGPGSVTVSWNQIAEANSYNLYYSTTPSFNLSNATRSTGVSSPTTISGLTSGTTYYFKITAVTKSGAESKPSAPVSATPRASWQGVLQVGVTNSSTRSFGLSTDSTGAVTIGGHVFAGASTGTLNGQTIIGVQDGFISKYDSSRQHVWTRTIGGTAKQVYIYDIAHDSDNNVYAAGSTSGGLHGNTQSGVLDVFVTKYNSDGTWQWSRQYGRSGRTAEAFGIAIDSTDNVYISGYTMGSLNGVTMNGTLDAFLIKFDSNGTRQWTKQLGVATKHAYSYGVAIDSNDEVYIGGYTNVGLNGGTLTGSSDYWLAKYEADGDLLWTRQEGVATKNSLGRSVMVDDADNVYIAGETTGALNGETYQGGGNNLFIVKYSSTGVKGWTTLFGGGSSTLSYGSLSHDEDNNIYVVASSAGSGGLIDNIAVTGTKDAYIQKYNSAGVKQWTKVLGATSGDTQGTAVRVHSVNEIYIQGHVNRGLAGNTLTGTIYDFFAAKFDSSGTRQ